MLLLAVLTFGALALIAAFKLGQAWERPRWRDPVVLELDKLRRQRDAVFLASGKPTFDAWPDPDGKLTLVMTRLPSDAVFLLREVYNNGAPFYATR